MPTPENFRYEWTKLASMIVAEAVDVGEFTLRSGRKSKTYIDIDRIMYKVPGPEDNDHFIHTSRGYELAAMLMTDAVGAKGTGGLSDRGLKIDAVGGPACGAIAIVNAILHYRSAVVSRGFYVKTDVYGGKVCGCVKPNDRVLLCEDVTTTGNSIRLAAAAVEMKVGAKIVGVVTLVDRGVDEVFKKDFPNFKAVYTMEDLGLRDI